MVSRTVVAGVTLVVLASAAVSAQQGTGASQERAQVRNQIRIFETILRNAVQQGGERLARRTAEVVPNVILVLDADPVVRGVVLPEYGILFDVQIPDILETGMALVKYYQERPRWPAPAAGRAGGAGAGRASAQGLPDPDPVTVQAAGMAAFDPNRDYTQFVREALIDAMLDNSGALVVAETDRLTVIASGIQGVVPNLLSAPIQEKLILSISGADLAAYRQQRITRDEARQRIRETTY